jgi:DNA-binding NtrC family response regulator
MKAFLVVSQQQDAVRTIRECFHQKYRVDKADNIGAALEGLRKRRYEFLFIDLNMLLGAAKEGNGYEDAMQAFWLSHPTIEIIVMSPQEMIREAVMAVKAGASNYLTFPLNPDEVEYVAESTYESAIMQAELDYLRDRFWQADSIEVIQTRSQLMREALENVRSVAPTKSTVLLIGETGTGKGLIAKLIHQHSSRSDGPFISVHCGAIPDTLLESELFGHEKGAFTGAVRRKLGKFEIAKGGTILLDEIGTITPSAQIKLLQILQDGVFQRVGGEETIDSNVRIIAATNSDLRKMCDEGQFRKDLYYRLNVFPIGLPPLRERTEDIPHLVEVLLKRWNRANSKKIRGIHPEVLEAFLSYPWPGNIRELENLIERAAILESSSVLSPGTFPQELFSAGVAVKNNASGTFPTLAQAREKGLENLERTYLREVLARNRGRIRESALTAGISTRQLHKIMTKLGMRKEEFKLSPL